MNAGTKEIEINKSARKPVYYGQEREAEAWFSQLCQQEELQLFPGFVAVRVFLVCWVFFQVANVRSAAHLADGCFATHYL